MKFLKYIAVFLTVFLTLLAGPGIVLVSGKVPVGDDWWSGSRESVGLAPDPQAFRDAVVQVYAARAWGWRGAFGVHTWIAVKPKNAERYTLLDVRMWRQYRSNPVLKVFQSRPDRSWFGNPPEVLAALTGTEAAEAIPRIMEIAENYPYANWYRVWPGPNSNTFTAHVGRALPELSLNLPPTAIGKDYFSGNFVSRTPSGGGFQLSVIGLLGILVSGTEGLEFNLLGLNFGINPFEPEIRLPGIGNVGL